MNQPRGVSVMVQVTCGRKDCGERFVTAGEIRGTDMGTIYLWPKDIGEWREVRTTEKYGWGCGYLCPAHAARLTAAEELLRR